MSCFEQLFAGLDRARSGDDHHFLTTDLHAAHVHDGGHGSSLPAHELEWLSDGNHVVDPRSYRERLDLMAAPAATDGGHDGALGPASDVGLESSFPNPLNDVLDLFRSGAVRHVHNHGRNPFGVSGPKQKPRSAIRGVGCETLSCLF